MLVIMGLLMLMVAGFPNAQVPLLYGALFVGIGIRLYFLRRRGISYSIFNTTNGKIRVMQDCQHDMILSELKKFRCGRLKKLLGTEELEQALAEIRAQHGSAVSPAPAAMTIQ